jgi:NTP pyrophosphatase (non-canonical NTP hydrolase)
MLHLKALQAKVMTNKIAKGFNTTDIPLEFMLLTEEVAEAFEAWRKKKPDIGEELADIMIYLMGLAEMLGLDLDAEVAAKMAINEKRTYVRKNGVLLKEEG